MKSIFASVLCLTLIAVAQSQTQLKPPTESALDRFLRYVKIDTQSQEDQTTTPSTRKQLNLANLLAKELTALGAQNVRVSEFGIVYAMVPGNLADNSKVPVVGFIAHMDTSPAVSGENVNPIIHKNYQGGDITLPKDSTQVITVAKNPVLKELIGDDIITADGTTLLGSDDKSGVAEVMTMIDILRQNPQVKHGTLAIAFTPDEEVGTGIEKFDVKGFGAKVAYTVDGEELGEISDETWSARTATITFQGKSTHPGTAKGIMVNAMYAMADYLDRFPKDMLPETTEGRVGFVHPYAGVIDVETSNLKDSVARFRYERARREGEAAARHGGANGGEVSRSEDHDRRQRELQEHEGSAEELSGPDEQRDGSCAPRRAQAVPETDSRRHGRIAVDFPGTADAEPFHGRREFSRQAGIQLAPRAGEDVPKR